jgi:N-acetyl-gamma-glutamyl-phosphate reductase
MAACATALIASVLGFGVGLRPASVARSSACVRCSSPSLITVFIDGEAGTTGLQVRSRLSKRSDVELITLPAAMRKDKAARAEAINKAAAVILCLPDAAAVEAASLVAPDNDRTVLIDASTAHRTNPEWAYGFPELSPAQREKISKSKRIANPGCYATGFIALIHPLVEAGIVSPDARLVASAVSGYSGGGTPLINIYEGSEPHEPWGAYGFSLAHKHLPEMRCFTGLQQPPIFLPAVGSFAQGMVVSVPLHYDRDLTPAASAAEGAGARIHAALSAHYADSHFVSVVPMGEKGMAEAGLLERGSFLRPDALNDTNHLQARFCSSPSSNPIPCPFPLGAPRRASSHTAHAAC